MKRVRSSSPLAHLGSCALAGGDRSSYVPAISSVDGRPFGDA